jgi:hypothetical protein
MNNHSISVSDLANGVYFVTGKSDGVLINEKIIINRQ